jgi:predicted nucleic acid-binding protein
VELRRLGLRVGLVRDVEDLLATVALVPMSDDVLVGAAVLEPANLTTLDAIHLATALHIAKDMRVDAFMTHDRRLADGARQHGFDVLSP